jgi:MFS family permease
MMEKVSTKQKVYPWLIVIGWGFMAAATLEICMINGSQFMPSAAQDLGTTVSAMSLTGVFYFSLLLVTAPIAGQLFARFDSRIVLGIMGAICVGTVILQSFYSEFWHFWVSGALFAIGGSGTFIIGAPIFISNWFKKRSGFAMGMYAFILAGLSLVISPIIAFLIQSLGWRPAYLAVAAIAAVLFFPFALFVVRFKPESIGLKAYGEYNAVEEKDAPKEEGSTAGVPYKIAIRSLPFILVVLAGGLMCNMSGFRGNMMNMAQMAPWDPDGLPYGIMFGGVMMSVVNIAKFCNPILGWIADKKGGTVACIVSLSLIVLGMLLFLFGHTVPVLVLVACVLFGFESCNMKVVIPLVIREIFGNKEYPKIYSLAFGILNFMGGFAASIVALIFETTGSFDMAFIYGICLAVGAFILLMLAKATSKKLAWEA